MENEKMIKQSAELVAKLDYECECKRLTDEIMKLRTENLHLKEAIQHLVYVVCKVSD